MISFYVSMLDYGRNAHNVVIAGFLEKLRLCLFFPLRHVPTRQIPCRTTSIGP